MFYFILTLLTSHLQAAQLPVAIDQMRSSIEKEYDADFSKGSLIVNNDEQSSKAKKDPSKRVDKLKNRGLSKVQELLAQKKAQLAKMKTLEQENNSSNNSKSKSNDWISEKAAENENWSLEKVRKQRAWEQQKQAQIQKWQKERVDYLKSLDSIKNQLIKFDEQSRATVSPIEKGAHELELLKLLNDSSSKDSLTKDKQKKYRPLFLSYMEKSFSLPIRSQGKRPTCAAFAAVRAMEILGSSSDLSEHYLYYLSKPKCQREPCSQRGSWPQNVFAGWKNNSIKKSIPNEKDCPYLDYTLKNNETQLPMKKSCDNATAQVTEYEQVDSRSQIQKSIVQGFPVVGGFKLNDKFFKNNGLVTIGDNDRISSKDHAQGHAVVLVGLMELPTSMHKDHGRFCTILSNSWGEGFGLGGHTCISDRWFDKFRYNMSFLAVKKIKD